VKILKKIEDFKVGEEFKLEKRIGKYQPIFYAGASGDFNPIHIDDEFAKMVGLGGKILQGLCTMAFVVQANVDYFGKEPERLKKIKVRFSRPVRPEDVVTIKGKITKIEDNKIYCEIIGINQKGEEVITNANSLIEF
jgi:acyl dehydratase